MTLVVEDRHFLGVMGVKMKIKLFEKDVTLADHHCNFNDTNGQKIKEPYINLYVKITDVCQAKCEFCEFCKDEGTVFDYYKFLYTFVRLNSQIKINKVSFTGGEPTLKIDLLNKLLKEVKEINPEIFTVVNTNGYKFTQINPDYVDSIALSRHHAEDHKNAEIFKTKFVPSWSDINSYKHKEKLHLSCNLIKGYVDSKDECYEHIIFYGGIGITDIGFVSLMGVNQYAKDHFIDFDEVQLDKMKNTLKSQAWAKNYDNKTVCKCSNYLTYNSRGDIVKSYARYYVDRTECKSILVYQENKLRAGFDGEIIVE